MPTNIQLWIHWSISGASVFMFLFMRDREREAKSIRSGTDNLDQDLFLFYLLQYFMDKINPRKRVHVAPQNFGQM